MRKYVKIVYFKALKPYTHPEMMTEYLVRTANLLRLSVHGQLC